MTQVCYIINSAIPLSKNVTHMNQPISTKQLLNFANHQSIGGVFCPPLPNKRNSQSRA